LSIVKHLKKNQMAQDYQKTQDSITRQSTLKFVGDYCKMIGTPLTLKEVVGVTNVLVDYCQNGYSKELGERLDKIDSHIKSLFEETI
jgi:hypothetical protein